MTTPVQFEASLQELQQIVEKMEHGQLSLEDSLTAFETGIRLTRQCQQALQDAEQKVQMLTRSNAGDTLTPFDSNGRSNG